MPISVEVKLPNVEKKISSLGKIATGARVETMKKALTIVDGEIKKSINRDWLSNGSSKSKRTGSLARSFKPEISVNNDGGFEGRVVSDLPYARIHELGGEIRPSRSQFLTIPLNGRSIPLGKTARDFADLFVWENKKTGKLFLARSQGKKLELVYYLAKRVTIRPKRYLKRAEERARPMIEALLGKSILTSIQSGGL